MFKKGYVLSERYIISKSIGEGGMANVYLAFDKILQRNVAIKVLRGDLSEDELFIKRFRREALAATALNHANIVQIFDIGEEDGKYYIVMEFVEGITLKQLLLKRKRLTTAEVVDMMKQVMLGISHAHSKNIIHRDIKPHNILVQSDGTIKITDFGIAVTLNSTLLTQTNSILGSVHYLPPEQVSSNVANVRSDIYSIGVLMYELLTGEPPFDGDSAVTIALMHVRNPFPSVRDYDSTIPQSLENIVIKSTAKNPSNRYLDVDSMYQDLCYSNNEKNSKKLVLDNKAEDEVINSLLNNNNDVEFEQVDQPKNKQRKRLIIIILIVMLIGVGTLVTIPFIEKSEQIIVPSVVGLSRSEATEKLIEEGFTVGEPTFESSTEYDIDTVISMREKEGASKPKGFTIILTISTGPPPFEVENYVGLNADIVKGELVEQNIIVSVREKDDAQGFTANTIVEQTPAPGTQIEAGEVVTLYIPKAFEKYPNFVAEKTHVSQVEAFCEKHAIYLKKIEEYNDTVEAGYVIAQTASPGSTVKSGDTLQVVISLGPKPVTETPVED